MVFLYVTSAHWMAKFVEFNLEYTTSQQAAHEIAEFGNFASNILCHINTRWMTA